MRCFLLFKEKVLKFIDKVLYQRIVEKMLRCIYKNRILEWEYAFCFWTLMEETKVFSKLRKLGVYK